MKTPLTSPRRLVSPLAIIVLFARVLAFLLLGGASMRAANTFYIWNPAAGVDYFTNGASWNPTVSGGPPIWNLNSVNCLITNNGAGILGKTDVCVYAASNVGDPAWTNTIGQLVLGAYPSSVVGTGASNTFIMNGGMLTLADTGGNDFCLGSASGATAQTSSSKNNFIMNDGVFNVTNTTGGNMLGMPESAACTATFNGGVANFENLWLGGRGQGTVTVNGGTLNFVTNSGANSGLLWIGRGILTNYTGANGTLNLNAGTVNATNTPAVATVASGATILLGQICRNSLLNVTGGTLNANGIQFGFNTKSNILYDNQTITVSGGLINLGAPGISSVSSDTETTTLSGGTFSTLSGQSWTWAGRALTNTTIAASPGPGIVNFAPSNGASITLGANGIISGVGGMNAAGPGTLVLANTNTYLGPMIVSGGAVKMTGSAALTGPISLAGGLFDVTGLASTFTLGPSQILSNNVSTATINGSINTGPGVVSLIYTSGTPAITVTNGTLTLSSSTSFVLNNTGAALPLGNYLIISAGMGGSVSGSAPGSIVTVTGGGLVNNASATVSISGGQAYLVVAYAAPIVLNQFPTTYGGQSTLFAGASPTFAIQASALPDTYYWYVNSVLSRSGSSSNFTLANIHVGGYSVYCVVSNFMGTAQSSTWQINVIAAPTAAFPSSVIADAPIGYWRLDEQDNGSGNTGSTAYDYIAGNNGVYSNVNLSQPGYSAIADPTETSALFGNTYFSNSIVEQIQGIDFAGTNVNSEFTVEAMVAITTNKGGGIVAKGYGNGGEEFCLDSGYTTAHNFRFFVRGASGIIYSANAAAAPLTNGTGNAANNVWYHLVGVCDEANGMISLYVNGVLTGSTNIPVQSGILNDSGWPMTIGCRAANQTSGDTSQTCGYIDDVAVYNYALSPARIAAHYSAAGFPPAFIQEPSTNYTLFVGGSATWNVSAAGAQPINYQWYSNNIPISGATTTNYVLTSASPVGSTQTYYCVAINSIGSDTNDPITVVVVSQPTAPYPASVLAANPIGYWRLNEADDNLSDGNPGAIAHDYWGGNNGIYTNALLGQQSYNSITDPSETSAYFNSGYTVDGDVFGIPGINFAAPTNNSVAFTVEAWADGYVQTKDAGIASKGYGGSEQFSLDTGGSPSGSDIHSFRFLVRDAAGNAYSASSSIKPNGNAAIWHHLVGVCDEPNSNVTLYVDGVAAASVSIPQFAGIESSSRSMLIGSRPSTSSSANDDQFTGYIDDVSVYNYAFTSNQVTTQYFSTGIAPSFTQVPTNSVATSEGLTLTVAAAAIGTQPLSYQWYDVNAGNSPILNQTNATLVISNINAAHFNGDSVYLKVSNTYGSTNSQNVSITVYSGPAVAVTNLPSQVILAVGQSFTYVIGVQGTFPMSYQWYNGASPVLNQTNSTYTLTAGATGNYTIGVVVSNSYGTINPSSPLTVVSRPANPLAANILSLGPVGYWPMHEVETPAQGDVEINYGTLGLVGTAYYPDWVKSYGSFTRGYQSAIAADGDSSVFLTSKANNGGDVTNALFVPHASPLTTLNPPFSVECWVYPTSNNQGDIWSQTGYEGLNAGASGNGDAGVCGIRLYWNPGFVVYAYDNGTANHNIFGTIPATTLNQWYHVVVMCDANTNFTIYTNGISASSPKAGVGLYAPDYWTPFEVGNGRGNSRAFSQGAVDELSIYTNLLAANDIFQHYSDGTNATPVTTYFSDVTADNPVVYLRMDSSSYSALPTNSWPVLTNYGVASPGGIYGGFYSPGTAPGVLSGPVNPKGIPFTGVSVTNVALLSGVSSYADVGYSTAYDPTGAVPFSVTAIFRGNPADNRSQTLVGHSTSSWRLWMNTSGKVQWQIGGKTLGSVGIYNDGNWHQVVGVYSPASTPNTTGTNLVYVDGVLDNSLSTVSSNGITPGSSSDVMIAADAQYTNNPIGLGQQFAGQICEVALFTNALSLAQVQGIYNSLQVAPFITAQPYSGRSVYGGAGTYIYFGVIGYGSALNYQWYFNATSNYSGATRLVDDVVHYTNSTTLQVTVTNLTTADSGYYYVVLNNSYGSVTSSLATLTVLPPQPQATLNPASISIYAGQPFTYTVQAQGTPPLYYQWFHNGTNNPIAGATGPSYTAIAGQSDAYYCLVSNAYNGMSFALAGPVTLTGLSAPASPYAAAVLGSTPIAYWRLDETGSLAYDYAGGHNAYYTNVQQGIGGYNTSDPDFAALFGTNLITTISYPFNSYVGELDLSGNGIPNIDFSTNGNAEFSVELWENATNGPLIAKGYGNGGEQFCIDFGNTGSTLRFFVRNGAGTSVNANTSIASDGYWHHLVGVCDEANGIVRFYVDGRDTADTGITPGSGIQAAGAGTAGLGDNRVSIGSRTQSSTVTTYNVQGLGAIDEVALYDTALTFAQISTHYQAGTNAIITPGTMTITTLSNGQVQLGWSFSGTLQSSTNVVSEYMDVPGATSPYTVPSANSQMFYRIRQHN